jgi:DNA-binding CsgD family transcriptional regulator
MARPALPPSLPALLEQVGGHAMRRLRLPDRSFRYAYASPHLAESFGIDVAAIIRQVPARHDWVHAEDRDRLVAALHRSGDALTPFDEEVRVLTPRGLRWVRSLSQPRRLADGTIVWDGIALDVTERREIAASLERAVDLARAAEARSFRELPAPDLLAAAREVLAVLGAEALSAAGAAALARLRAAAGDAGPADPALSPRQQEVASLLAAGLPNREIGRRLGITEGTAKLHVAAVLKRLGAPSRARAAALLRGSATLAPPPC